LQWFPLRGLTSSNWDELSWAARVVDYLWHIALPVTAMVLGSFAVTAILTKNAFFRRNPQAIRDHRPRQRFG